MVKTYRSHGFTIVELLIVIVVIAILATLAVVAYNGIQQRAQASALSSSLSNAARILKLDEVNNGSYPASLAVANNGNGLNPGPGMEYRYSTTGNTFCLTATAGVSFYMITENSVPSAGSCVNVARGKSATSALITDGNTATTSFYDAGTGVKSVQVDLGSAQKISVIKVWHYYADGRTYNQTKTEVSTDGTNWVTVFDSASSGTYVETSSGRTTSFPVQDVRYIRDWTNGSTSNTSNHWVEIQAF